MVGLYIVSFVIHSFHLNISIKVLYSFWFSMACQMKKKLLLLLLVLLVSNLQHCVNGTQQVPCFFIFGDSLSDNGNNNNLVTKAKANYQPYGIDFPGGPTGRFTNGRNLVDIIGQYLPFFILFYYYYKIYTRYSFYNFSFWAVLKYLNWENLILIQGEFLYFGTKLILIPRAS